MSIIAVMNRKGGCGKSTLATQIASWYASTGSSVVLGSTDKQRSTEAWFSRRSSLAAPLSIWPNDPDKNFWAVPGHTHFVVDTPCGIFGLELAKHLARVDAVVLPVGPSLFDFETSVDFFNELSKHPRVSSGRCQVAVVGMRWPAQDWKSNDGTGPLQFLTAIPDAPIYRSCLDSGSSLFDEADDVPPAYMQPWTPLLDWLVRLPKSAGALVSLRPALDRLNSKALQSQHEPRLDSHSPEAFLETLPPTSMTAAELKSAGIPFTAADFSSVP